MAQEGDLLLQKVVLTEVEGEAIRVKHSEHLPEGRHVGSHVRGANKNVVQVDEGVEDVRQEAVHQALKRLGGVLQPKWHEDVLIQAKWGNDHRLKHISISNRYLVVTFDKVQPAEDGAAHQLAAEALHVGQGVPVGSCDIVEPPVVFAGAPVAVRLFYHVEW